MQRCLVFAAFASVCVNCGPDETVSGYADPAATYQLQTLNGLDFASVATIAFPQEGSVTGAGPCNSFRADQTAPYPWFDIGPIAATRRACPELADEQRYFTVLSSMSIAEVNGRVLLLTNEAGNELFFQSD